MAIYRPTTRVMAVLELLQSHVRLSGAELAQRLQVDARTVRRYIAMLEELGIPIVTERGPHGGYALIAGYKLPPMIFTNEEALALSLGLLAAAKLGLSKATPALQSAQSKLERVMPVGVKQTLRALHQTVILDLPVSVTPDSHQTLAAITLAAQQQRTVALQYRTANEQLSQRQFDPYSVLYQNSAWYAIGFCHLRQNLRSFRLDRMTELTMLEDKFVAPEDFDAVTYLREAVASIPRRYSTQVRIKREFLVVQADICDWMGILEAVPDGVILHSQTDDLDWYARKLAGISFDFEIMQPEALRLALKNYAQVLLARLP